jgi:hypothetical protein
LWGEEEEKVKPEPKKDESIEFRVDLNFVRV